MTQDELLQETHDKVLELHAVVLGVNADKGLVGKVNQVCDDQALLEAKHNKLARTVWVLIGVLVGSGVLGAGIYELIKVIA